MLRGREIYALRILYISGNHGVRNDDVRLPRGHRMSDWVHRLRKKGVPVRSIEEEERRCRYVLDYVPHEYHHFLFKDESLIERFVEWVRS